MRWLSLTSDPKIIEHMANRFKGFGWTKEDFIESYTELRRTGLYNVEGEVAWRDDITPPKLYKSSFGKFLDAGTIFFKETERMLRIQAWNLAYKEWKKANPYVRITDRERNRILNRAKNLSVNMTRDSNAPWQRGILSVPTQFFAYQVRLMEQMLGKRLTKQEKFQALTAYSLMYGVPTAAGAITAFWPYNESIRTEAMKRGWNVDDPKFELFMDGLLSTSFKALFGEDLNYSERMGPGGLTILRELSTGNKGLADLILGASGTILEDFATSLDPTLKLIKNIWNTTPDTEYPFMWEDVFNETKVISTVNNTARAVYAFNFGRYLTNYEIYIDDITPLSAILMGITGLSPQEISDTFLLIPANRDREQTKKDAQRFITKYVRRGVEALYQQNNEEAERYFRAARIHLIGAGFRPDEYSASLMQALNNQQSLVDKIRKEFFIDNAPYSQIDQRREEYMRQLQQEATQQ
jgi:hypothetical protein